MATERKRSTLWADSCSGGVFANKLLAKASEVISPVPSGSLRINS